MMKTDAGTCASIRIFINNFFQTSNHFLLYTPIDRDMYQNLLLGLKMANVFNASKCKVIGKSQKN